MSSDLLEFETARQERLALLAEEIRREHQAAFQSMRKGIEHALKVGELLLQAKENVWYGEWEKWVETNCDFTPRMARNYMNVARYRRRLETETISEVTIAGALASARVQHYEDAVGEYGASIKRELKERKAERKAYRRTEDSLSPAGRKFYFALSKARAEIKEYLVHVEREGVSWRELAVMVKVLERAMRHLFFSFKALEKSRMKSQWKRGEGENYVEMHFRKSRAFSREVRRVSLNAEGDKFSEDSVEHFIAEHDKVRRELEELEKVLKQNMVKDGEQ